MYLHVQKWTSVKLDLLHCLAHDWKSPERGNVANVFAQRSWFRESLFDKKHDFNGTSLEVNKIWQSFYLGRMLNRNLHKVVYKKLQKFVLDSAIESAFEIHVRRKEIVFDWCTRSHSQRNTGRPIKNCDWFAWKSIRLPSNSSLVIFTILFQVKVKC